eukprot:TRINITY_DN2292_c3_g1_i1.p1 TRINITY_DN2292_c3_g1~~TRINITY_DN2292_c3_g1_i1.p1  ORF type:complete len:270 (+),score=48.55 TRINITY_DN2292_c3_g1_i1:132-941(+)
MTTPSPSPVDSYTYDGFPDFYDMMVASLPAEYGVGDDVEFYKRHIPGKKVLDLATGTGRVAGELRNALGEDAVLVGVDYSEAMVKSGRKKHPSVKFVQASMTAFDVKDDAPAGYDAVIVAAGSVVHLTSLSDREVFMTNVAQHLAHGGLAFIDLLPVSEVPWSGKAGQLVEPLQVGDFTRTHISSTSEEREFDEVLFHDGFLLQQGDAPSVRESWSTRSTNPPKFLDMAKKHGLMLTAAYNSWTDSPVPAPTTDNPCFDTKWIFIFEKN